MEWTHLSTLDKLSVDPVLIEGAKFLKWTDHDANVAQRVTLHLDQNGFFLYWRESNKDKEVSFLDVSQIRDVRTGATARVPKDPKLREMISMGSGCLEDKTVTVVYGSDFVNTNFYNFCSNKKEIAKTWHDELLKITTNVSLANLSSLQSLRKIHTLITLNPNTEGKIPIKAILKLFAQNKEDRKFVERALDLSHLPSKKDQVIDPERFSFENFFLFYQNLAQRKEIENIFLKFAGSEHLMSKSEFLRFVNEQRDPRLNEILFPYCTEAKAQFLIQQNEPDLDNVEKGRLSLEGFLRYLLSEDNQIVGSEYLDLHASMNEPLSHYFIQSSHNTYLTGHQWTGRSSVEIYRQVLLSGCRCIELDLWDGTTKEEEPVIKHGYTLVPEILAKDVIVAIAECAFKTSVYPVILSFENHCKPKQQVKIANYCREYFGDMLLSEPLGLFPLEKGEKLPSPNDLKYKIIIKNKKKHIKEETVEEEPKEPLTVAPIVGEDKGDSDSDEEEELEISQEVPSDESRVPPSNAGRETKVAEEISRLVNYVQAVHFHGFSQAESRDRSFEMSSFEESNAVYLLKEQPIEFVNYNKRQLSRIFPRGTRMDSSNFMPQVFWNAGCQLVALNFQTLDLSMQLNLGMFEYNKRCGYLQKPPFMCRKDRTFDPFADTPVDGIVPATVSIQVLSGQFLTDRHVGTYVDVDMFGLPCDTVRRKFRTKVVPNNGICPVFTDEPFLFKQVVLPDLAVIRIAVYEESGRFIGHRVLPVSGLRPGYRHITLRNESGQYLYFPTLFCHVKVQDFVPDRFSNFADALANPIRYQSEIDKRTQQLLILTEEEKTNENAIKDPDEMKRVKTLPTTILSPMRKGEYSSYNQDVPKEPLSISINASSTSISTMVAAAAATTVESSTSVVTKRWTTSSFEEDGRISVHSSPGVGIRPVCHRTLTMTSSTGKVINHFSNNNNNNILANNRGPPKSTYLTVETVESFLSHKSVVDKKSDLQKRLKQLNKKYEKKIERITQDLKANEEKFKKGSGKCNNNKPAKNKLVKILSEKTLDVSRNGDEAYKEAQDKFAKAKKQYEEKLSLVTKEREKSELELKDKYFENIWCCAEKIMKSSQAGQLKSLDIRQEKDIGEVMKSIEIQANFEIKEPKDGNKEEILRVKRERRSFIIKRGVEERKRLEEFYANKKKELEERHQEIRNKFFIEKESSRSKITSQSNTNIATSVTS